MAPWTQAALRAVFGMQDAHGLWPASIAPHEVARGCIRAIRRRARFGTVGLCSTANGIHLQRLVGGPQRHPVQSSPRVCVRARRPPGSLSGNRHSDLALGGCVPQRIIRATWMYRVALNTAVAWTRKDRHQRGKQPLAVVEGLLTASSAAPDPRVEWHVECDTAEHSGGLNECL